MDGVLHESGWRVCYMRVDEGCVTCEWMEGVLHEGGWRVFYMRVDGECVT